MIDKKIIDDLVSVLKEAFSVSSSSQIPKLNDARVRLASHGCDFIAVKKGQPFIQVGFPADTIWVLLRGSAQVVCYNRQGGYCVQDAPQKTQLFGLMEQLNHQETYTATVYTSTDCQLFRIPSRIFMAGLDMSIPLLRLALDDLCILAERAMNQTEFQTLYMPRDYLIIFLSHYCSQCDTFPCVVQVTRKEIAEQLHMNLRSLYRYIDDLKIDGLFTIKHGKITISKEQADLLHEYCRGL